MGAEQGSEPEPCTVNRVAHDRSDQRRDDRLDLDVVYVQDLRREHGASERCAEDSADASTDSRGDGDPAVLRVGENGVAEQRAETRRDLRRRSLATSRPTGPDGDGGGDELHGGTARPDPAAAPVKRLD